MNSYGTTPSDFSRGEDYATQVRQQIETLGLASHVTANYVRDRAAVRLMWRNADETLDVPAEESWIDWLGRVLPRYAERVAHL